MKNRRILLLAAVIVTLFTTAILPACNKKFDEPPVNSLPSLSELGYNATMTIDSFKTKTLVNSGGYFRIIDSVVIVGQVTANDKSGNFYKQIYIQDTSGAIELDLDVSGGLYNQFPVGRFVAVIVKSGLYVANVNGMQKICMKTVQNGTPAVLGIPQALISNYVVAGNQSAPIEPRVVTISQLNSKLKGSLVKLENFEVPFPDVLFSTWADSSANKNTLNVNIKNCSGEATIVRSSAYANFSALPVPTGNGSVTAIYTVFNSTPQLIIRDTADVQFKGTRCDGTIGNLNVRSIQDLRTLTPSDVIGTYDVIEGVIVSGALNESPTARSYRMEDASGYGIQVRFTTGGDRQWALGDKVRAFIGGLSVAPFNGDLQINNVPVGITLGTGTVIPRLTTIADINANINDWASSVVTINNVTIALLGPSGPGMNYSITDANGNSIVSFIRNTLNYTPPATATSVTGYASLFSGTSQLTIRQASDIK